MREIMESETWVIQRVTEVEEKDGVHYHVVMRTPLGDRLYMFSDDSLEWRAAEYGFDPEADFDTLLDLILHEPFIPDPLTPKNFADDAAQQAGKTSKAVRAWGRSVAVGDDVPTCLQNAASVEEAKEAQLIRLEHAKNSRVKIIPPQVSLLRGVSKPQDPLDLIRQNRVLDSSRMEEKRQHVEKIREAHRQVLEEATSPRPIPRSTGSKPQSRTIYRPVGRTVTPVPYDKTDRQDRKTIEGEVEK